MAELRTVSVYVRTCSKEEMPFMEGGVYKYSTKQLGGPCFDRPTSALLMVSDTTLKHT